MPESFAPYRVLARAYRPSALSGLVGQDALVRTLNNAMASGRIAHAYLLCGIRGVGKTTTARIIAKGLNCVGADGQGGPTPEPCGVCPSCVAIQTERSLDVIEMDAASHTGKEDVLELIEGVRYAPTASRYKVYIIDEIHMLSEKAFNALLKTIEEPPPHAKFVFATTEARKVPITVLSRCQRFDLRRVEPEVLQGHLRRICDAEGILADDEALALVAGAAEGSVRDSLSLLDQAIAIGDGRVDALGVADMLGLGDRAALLDLFDALMGGEAGRALDGFGDLWAKGADPAALLGDLLEIAHWLSCLKLDRKAVSVFAARPDLAARGTGMAERLGLATLNRAWSVLLKGMGDVRAAPDARAAAEMVLLRLATMGDLPPPGELVAMLRGGAVPAGHAARTPSSPADRHPADARTAPATQIRPAVQSRPLAREEPAHAQAVEAEAPPATFGGLVDRLRAVQPMLAAQLIQGAHPIDYRPGRLEMRLDEGLPTDIATRLNETLLKLFGTRWVVVLGRGEGGPTLAEQERAEAQAQKADLADDPQIQAVLAAYPGAKLVDVRRATTNSVRKS